MNTVLIIDDEADNASVNTKIVPLDENGKPLDDFDVNASGTLNLLEATRQTKTDIPFVHLSTNKVYGDAPNNLNIIELDTRYEFGDPEYFKGINDQQGNSSLV